MAYVLRDISEGQASVYDDTQNIFRGVVFSSQDGRWQVLMPNPEDPHQGKRAMRDNSPHRDESWAKLKLEDGKLPYHSDHLVDHVEQSMAGFELIFATRANAAQFAHDNF